MTPSPIQLYFSHDTATRIPEGTQIPSSQTSLLPFRFGIQGNASEADSQDAFCQQQDRQAPHQIL